MHNFDDITIPTYIINLEDRKDRLKHVLKQFAGKSEFDLTVVKACHHENGRIGLWLSIVKVINIAIQNNDDVIIICEDDHMFTEQYSRDRLLKNILGAAAQGVNILSGGIGGFNLAIPTSDERYWIDWFWCTQFIVIYKGLFDAILKETFSETDTADGKLSGMTSAKMVIYPFISIQKDFGYSDVTVENDQRKGLISMRFSDANSKLATIHHVHEKYTAINKTHLQDN